MHGWLYTKGKGKPRQCDFLYQKVYYNLVQTPLCCYKIIVLFIQIIVLFIQEKLYAYIRPCKVNYMFLVLPIPQNRPGDQVTFFFNF